MNAKKTVATPTETTVDPAGVTPPTVPAETTVAPVGVTPPTASPPRLQSLLNAAAKIGAALKISPPSTPNRKDPDDENKRPPESQTPVMTPGTTGMPPPKKKMKENATNNDTNEDEDVKLPPKPIRKSMHLLEEIIHKDEDDKEEYGLIEKMNAVIDFCFQQGWKLQELTDVVNGLPISPED